jgi:hypothetical protein
MTASGHERTLGNVRHESAPPLKADIDRRDDLQRSLIGSEYQPIRGRQPSWACDRDRSPAGVPSGLSPFLCFKLLGECSEMRGDGSRQGVVLAFEALPNC